MQSVIAFLALVASVSAASPSVSAPVVDGGIPSYCSSNFDGTFEISPQNQSTYKPNPQIVPSCTTNPIISLQNGTAKDQDNRQAEVVANDQFQFDPVLQDPRKYDTGFQVCTNPSTQDYTLAHGGNTTFFRCNSGSFDNIYDENIDGKCTAIYVVVLPCGSSSKPDQSGAGSGSSVAPSSAVSTSAVSSVATSAPSPSATVATTPAVASPSSVPVVAPYPTGNATTPAASGTGSPSSTGPGTSHTSPLTAPASGADVLAIGSKFAAVAAAAMAFALL